MKISRNIGLPGLAAIVILAVSVPGVVLAADYEAGMNYFRAGKYVEAAAEFQALVETSPDYDYGYFILGHSFLKMNKPNDAIENFRKAIDLNGDKFEYHYGLAGAYVAAGNFQRALAALNEAEPLVGNNAYAFHSLRGTAEYQLKKWSDAITDLEKANKLEKNDAKKAATYDMIGKAYHELRTYDKAADAFRSSNGLKPDLQTQQLLTLALTNAAGQADSDASKDRFYKQAFESAQAAAQKAPNDFDVVNMLGRAALGAKQYAAAVTAFDKTLSMKPDYCPAMVNKAKTLIATEAWGQAADAITKAEKCDPKMAFTCQELLGFTYRKMERLDDAIKAYEKAQSIKPSPAIAKAIEEIRYNIEVKQHNANAAAEEAQSAAEAERIRKEQEEMDKKVKEWEKKRDN